MVSCRVGSCCCFSLRTGTLILLYLNFFISVLSISSSQVTVETKEGGKTVVKYYNKYSLETSIVMILASLAGLWGVYKEKSIFLLGYLIVHIIILIIYIALAILLVTAMPKIKNGAYITFLAFYIITVVIYSYLVRVIYSYYKSLSDSFLP